jgi:Nucleoside diphosphate kinase
MSTSSGIHLPHFLGGDAKPAQKDTSPNAERSFIMIKPDGVQRNLVGKIIARFEERGYKIVAMKMVHATTEHLEKRM